MKFSRIGWLCVAAACCATSVGVSSASAQTAPAAAAPKQVVVVDIAKVFKEFQAFNAEMEAMKADVDAYEEFLRGKQTELQAISEARAQFKPNAPEYKEKDTQILQIQSQLSVEATTKKKEFMEREAQIYFEYYTRIIAQIDDFSTRNGVSLVLRYNSEEIDPLNRVSIQQGVNNAVVFQRNCDITRLIINSLNPTQGPGDSTARGPIVPPGGTLRK